MRGPIWVLVAALAIAPTATAAHSHIIQVEAQLESLSVPGPAHVAVRDALLRAVIDPMRIADAPLVRLDGGVVHVRQYWLNSTSIVEPATGNVLYRWSDPWTMKDLAFHPDRIQLINPIDRPDVRLHVHSLFGVDFERASATRLENGRPMDVLGPSRANGALNADLLQAFDRPPTDAGWLSLRPAEAQGFGDVDYLIDGWGLRLGHGEDLVDVHTGTHRDYVHRFGEGGQVRESYSFLHIMVLGARHTFADHLGGFEGFAAAPRVSWDGPADLRVHGGNLRVGGTTVPLTQPDLRLEGRFETNTEFGTDAAFAGAPFHATGTGTTNAALPAALLAALPLPQQAGFWTSLAVGTAAVAVLGVQTYRAPRRTGPPAPAVATAHAPAMPAPSTIETLIDRAQKAPLDADAQFELGIALMRHGEATIGARALDRSFRLQPGCIVKLLEDPSLAPVREQEEVRVLLGRFQREQHRKVWAGYA